METGNAEQDKEDDDKDKATVGCTGVKIGAQARSTERDLGETDSDGGEHSDEEMSKNKKEKRKERKMKQA